MVGQLSLVVTWKVWDGPRNWTKLSIDTLKTSSVFTNGSLAGSRRYIARSSRSLVFEESMVSSLCLVAALARGVQRNHVENCTSMLCRESPCVERRFEVQILQFVSLLSVWAESFECQTVFEVWLQLVYIGIYVDVFRYRFLIRWT
jgi:hypothetical protein